MAAVSSVPIADLRMPMPMPDGMIKSAHRKAAHAHKLPFVTGRWTVAAVDSVPIDRVAYAHELPDNMIKCAH